MKISLTCLVALALGTIAAGNAADAAPTAASAPETDWTAVNDQLFAGPPRNLEHLATRAYVWGMPLVEAAWIRQRFLAAPGARLNRFYPRRALSGPELRVGVGPNNDTIYTPAWVDLARGPLIVSLPDFGKRYYTVSINQADSSAEQSLGQRTHGGKLPPLFVHGPGYSGPVPKGMVDVPVSTRYANLAGRILVRNEGEYAEVHRLQDQFRIARPDGSDAAMPARPPALTTGSEPLHFLNQLGVVLKEWIVRPQESGIVRSLAALGLTPEKGFDRSRLSLAQVKTIARGIEQGRKLVLDRSLNLGVQVNGWTINYQGPRFGNDYLLRAGVAKDQIYVTIPEEAVYPIGRVDSAGRPLSGQHRYTIRFAADQLPPVNAFWSITAYDDQGFMMPNPIKRYSIGDRTGGLVRGKDGSVTIVLAKAPPTDLGAANWLPVGKDSLYLMMRLYMPKEQVIERRWTPPAIVRLPARKQPGG
jgi:hypothetical protein